MENNVDKNINGSNNLKMNNGGTKVKENIN